MSAYSIYIGARRVKSNFLNLSIVPLKINSIYTLKRIPSLVIYLSILFSPWSFGGKGCLAWVEGGVVWFGFWSFQFTKIGDGVMKVH